VTSTNPTEPPAQTQAQAEALAAQVALVLASDGLGRSPMLERLLRFLLASAEAGRAPKEAEIAAAVFDR